MKECSQTETILMKKLCVYLNIQHRWCSCSKYLYLKSSDYFLGQYSGSADCLSAHLYGIARFFQRFIGKCENVKFLYHDVIKNGHFHLKMTVQDVCTSCPMRLWKLNSDYGCRYDEFGKNTKKRSVLDTNDNDQNDYFSVSKDSVNFEQNRRFHMNRLNL